MNQDDRTTRRRAGALLTAAVLALSGCGSGAPARFDPGVPPAPTAVTATAGNRRATLAWGAAPGASAYRVYAGTSPGVTPSTATVASGPVTSTSFVVTGLSNGVTYWFAVSATSSSGESAPSAEVSATPAAAGPFAQADLLGTWRLAVLSAGADAGWARGTLSVDEAGATTFTAYADSAGRSAAPAGFLARLLLDDSGHVGDGAPSAQPTFTGVLAATNRALIVASVSGGATESLVILQLHDPAVRFVPTTTWPNDLAGFGGGNTAAGGGARKFAFDQISSGPAPQEWTFALGQIGKTPPPAVQYTNSASGFTIPLPYLTASSPSGATAPVDKATTFALDAEGVASEALNPAITAGLPEFVLPEGCLSDDKTILVGVGSTRIEAAPRHVLRVYHLMNLTIDDLHTASLADLAGTWTFQQLVVGDVPRSAWGTLRIDASGGATFPTYADSSGGAAPGALLLALDASPIAGFYGRITSPQDATLNGKLSYFGDVLVITRTEPSGASSFLVAAR